MLRCQTRFCICLLYYFFPFFLRLSWSSELIYRKQRILHTLVLPQETWKCWQISGIDNWETHTLQVCLLLVTAHSSKQNTVNFSWFLGAISGISWFWPLKTIHSIFCSSLIPPVHIITGFLTHLFCSRRFNTLIPQTGSCSAWHISYTLYWKERNWSAIWIFRAA